MKDYASKRAQLRKLRAKYRRKIFFAGLIMLILGLIGGYLLTTLWIIPSFTGNTAASVEAEPAAEVEMPAFDEAEEQEPLSLNFEEEPVGETEFVFADETEEAPVEEAEFVFADEIEEAPAEEAEFVFADEIEEAPVEEAEIILIDETEEAPVDETEALIEEEAEALIVEEAEELIAEETEEVPAEETEEAAAEEGELSFASLLSNALMAYNANPEGAPVEEAAAEEYVEEEAAAEEYVEEVAVEEVVAEEVPVEEAPVAEEALAEEVPAEAAPVAEAAYVEPTFVPYGETAYITTQIKADGSARLTADADPYETVYLSIAMEDYKGPDYFEKTYSDSYNLQGDEAAAQFNMTLYEYAGNTEIIPQNFLLITFSDEAGENFVQGFQLMDSEIAGKTEVALATDTPTTLYKRYSYNADQGAMAYMVVTTYNDGEEALYCFELLDPNAAAAEEAAAAPAEGEAAAETADGGVAAGTVLTIGSQGDDVKKLQAKLIELGQLFGQPDGKFGNYTASAIKEMQKRYGMEPTGIADEAFLNRLYG